MALQYPPYQPSFYGVQQTPAFNPIYPQSQAGQSNILWVPGNNGAKSFPGGPGINLILLDSEEEGIMYIKTFDNVGMPNKLRKFRYEEILEDQPDTVNPNPQYITKEEFEKAMNELRHQPRYNNNNRKGDRNEQPV